MTQKALKEASRLSQAYIAQIENGTWSAITADTLFRLCAAFKVECDHFSRYFAVAGADQSGAGGPSDPGRQTSATKKRK